MQISSNSETISMIPINEISAEYIYEPLLDYDNE